MSTSARSRASLNIRVIPRAPRTRIDGVRGSAIVVRLAAPPVEGAANDALIAFLAETCATGKIGNKLDRTHR